MTTPQVLITRHLPSAAAEVLRAAGFGVHAPGSSEPVNRETLLERVRGVSGLLCTLHDRIDAELLDAAGAALRVVANFAVGFENIDLSACTARRVWATNTPGVLTAATADLAWALILAAARRIGEGERMVRAGQWTGWAPTQLLGMELDGSTLGIVGAGLIGSAVGRRAVGFGMKIVYSHPRPRPDFEQQTATERGPGACRVTLDELLRSADVVTLHVPMRPENHHLIGAAQLALMKPSAILVNTARGAVVDEAALVSALRDGWIAAAGLDVYEHEPRLTPGLTELPNAVLLPHLGSATQATRERMARLAARNIVEVLTAGRPLTPVNQV